MPIPPVNESFRKVGDLTLHTVQWGERGQPVVCVHGITSNAFYFQALADQLAPDYRVFAYDLRGRGQSEKPASGYGLPAHAVDLLQLLDILDLDKPALVGHSMGGLVALYFAAHYPTRLSKLVLLDSGGPLAWDEPTGRYTWLAGALKRLGTSAPSFADYRARLQTAPFAGPYWNNYFDIYYEHDVEYASDGSVTARPLPAAALADEEYLETHNQEIAQLWPRITVPTLLLRAGQGMLNEHDQFVSEATALTVQQSIRDCRLISYADLNHYTIGLGASLEPFLAIKEFLGEKIKRRAR